MLLAALMLIGWADDAPAGEPLRVRLCTSVTGGERVDDAMSETEPMIGLIERDIGYRIDFRFETLETEKELDRLGEALDQGAIHLAVMWGLEYGWLRKKGFSRLQPLVLLKQHEEAWKSELRVRDDFVLNGFDDLKGRTLALYRHIPMPDRVYLASLVKPYGATVAQYFKVPNEEYATVDGAIIAVRREKADCVLMNTVTYSRHLLLKKNVTLTSFISSDPFPVPVIVGRPDRVNQLSAGLWKKVRESLVGVDSATRGRRCLEFWRIQRFIQPAAEFEGRVRRRADEYPIGLLKRFDAIDHP